jgi:hypothetical protein
MFIPPEVRLQKIKRSTTELVNVLSEKPPDNKQKFAPEFEADNLIMMNCKELPELGGARVMGPATGRRYATRLLADLLSRFLFACDRAERELGLFKGKEKKWNFSKTVTLGMNGSFRWVASSQNKVTIF